MERLQLPENVSADFDLVNYSGPIETDLGRIPSMNRENDLRSDKIGLMPLEAHFSTGSGGASIKAETFNGSIAIHKE